MPYIISYFRNFIKYSLNNKINNKNNELLLKS